MSGVVTSIQTPLLNSITNIYHNYQQPTGRNLHALGHPGHHGHQRSQSLLSFFLGPTPKSVFQVES